MLSVVSELAIGQYKVLSLDGPLPNRAYNRYVISGKDFACVPLYDIPNSIAIESAESFVGKKVEFK
jgi:hypothetical protein